jgi:hypothetical protein
MSILRPTRAPNLLNSPQQYMAQHFDQLLRELRVYFNTLDNGTSALFGRQGGDYLSLSYGSFYDTTTQTAGNTTTAYPITINTTVFSEGVSIEDNSKITFKTSGVYNLQFSMQLSNDTNDVEEIDIWFRKNLNDIPDSNSRFGLAPRKSSGAHYHTIAALNFFVDVEADDFVQIVWRTSNTSANIEAYAAGTSPDRPAVPSVILTVTRVSAVVPTIYG